MRGRTSSVSDACSSSHYARIIGTKDNPTAPASSIEQKGTKRSVTGNAAAISLAVLAVAISITLFNNRNNNTENVTNSVANIPEGDAISRLSRPSTPASVATVVSNATFTNELGMEFMQVPKGTSWMGGYDGNPGSRQVEMPNDFMMGKCEVTQGEWEAIVRRVHSAITMHSQPDLFERFDQLLRNVLLSQCDG